MNILLDTDTHVLILLAIEPQKLSQQAVNIVSSLDNTLFLSLVSVWEMQIKIQIGKLSLNMPLLELIECQQQVNGVQILAIELAHILALDILPNHHRDPFDRLLLAQATVTQMPILSTDAIFDRYGLQRLW